MDSKGTEEEITYPNIFFMIDNFEEVSFLKVFVIRVLPRMSHLLVNSPLYIMVFLVIYDDSTDLYNIFFQGRPVHVRHDVPMHYGQNRGMQKTWIKQ